MNSLAYIDSVDSKRHLLLAYSEPNYAHKIQFRFINNGLMKNEHCIFITHEKTKTVENEMFSNGIYVDKYKNRNLLHIYQTPDPIKHPVSILDGYYEIIKMILADSKPPYRITGLLSHDIKTEEAISLQQHFDEFFHSSMFESFNGSVLCTYPLSEIQENDRWQYWLARIESCHNASIIQTRDGREYLKFNNNEFP